MELNLDPNKLENLITKSKEFEKSLNEIKSRQNDWNESVKELIYQTLKIASQKIGLGTFVDKNEITKNHESVCLSFGKSVFGTETDLLQTQIKAIIKDGGYICYSQNASGKVSAWIAFPEIPGIKENIDQEIHNIGSFEPQELKPDEILNHAEIFIEKMIQWEEGQRDSIGFKLSNS